jgi:hypothetical protein
MSNDNNPRPVDSHGAHEQDYDGMRLLANMITLLEESTLPDEVKGNIAAAARTIVIKTEERNENSTENLNERNTIENNLSTKRRRKRKQKRKWRRRKRKQRRRWRRS